MRLYLAVAVLLLAFVAYTEAQETTLEEKITNIGQTMTEFGQNVAEKAKAALAEFHENENVKKAKDWIQEQLNKFRGN